MADRYSKKKRRAIMQSVRSKDTAPEQIAEELLTELGLHFERNVSDLPGKPDFYFPDQELVVFVHGCFWHGHQACAKGRKRPSANRKFWNEKLDANIRRDRRTARTLRQLGFSVYTIWECQLKREQLSHRIITRLLGKT